VTSTRTSAAWTAVVAGFVLAVFLLIFLIQNTGSVRISLLGASGRLPLAVALLAAALFGALVVIVAAVARTAQLRVTARRHRRQDLGIGPGDAGKSQLTGPERPPSP
jgi:uncharacterized integral membrane protein